MDDPNRITIQPPATESKPQNSFGGPGGLGGGVGGGLGDRGAQFGSKDPI